ncbi:MAG TPA: HD domain-containing phosphohydrolase [Gaiellaceae bacterium]|nr:HD domain-containing phosphohydrolase [Gaiellaceae bacterium]
MTTTTRTPAPAQAPPAPWATPALACLLAHAERADPSLRLHSSRVTRLSLEIGRLLGLVPARLAVLAVAAAVHDVGKLAVAPAILAKPAELDAWERSVVERHPLEGERLLEPHVGSRELLAIVRSHHERWDGAGYPDGLAGEAIPLGARIVAVADAFTAMVEPRPYRVPRPSPQARAELLDQAGRQFDPVCAHAGFAATAAFAAA